MSFFCAFKPLFIYHLTGLGGYPAFTASQPATLSSNQEEETTEEEAPTSPKPKSMLVISGGEGYIDFRIGNY